MDSTASRQVVTRQVVIGDVHGHYQGLMDLFHLLELGETDLVYFLGDLIDRGPDSAQVVDFVKEGAHSCLLGNHEQLMLESFGYGRPNHATLQMWLHCGGRATLDSYQSVSHLQSHLRWMQSLPTCLDLGDTWLVHAGVHPDIPLEQQTAREFCWIRDDFHRIRQPYFPNKLIVTGHTITFTFPGVQPGQLAQGQGWLDIETGAYHPKSGWMTALDLTYQQVYQVNVFNKTNRVGPLADAIVQLDLNSTELLVEG